MLTHAQGVSDYYGLPVIRLGNASLRLDFLADRGPRLVRLLLAGSDENLLGETPEAKWQTPYGEYILYGGHRLWHAPEVFPRTYIPEEGPVEVEEFENGVRIYRPPEEATGISKAIEARLLPDRPIFTLDHFLKNEGQWPVELAPWAITQLPLGGTAILPQTTGPVDPSGLQPNRSLALWPYSHWKDERLAVEDDLVLVHAWAKLPPLKIGMLSRVGWSGYLHDGVLLTKRFQPRPDRPHTDSGCNLECYVNDLAIELESLGPLARLGPGESASLRETWEIHRAPGAEGTVEGAREIMGRMKIQEYLDSEG